MNNQAPALTKQEDLASLADQMQGVARDAWGRIARLTGILATLRGAEPESPATDGPQRVGLLGSLTDTLETMYQQRDIADTLLTRIESALAPSDVVAQQHVPEGIARAVAARALR